MPLADFGEKVEGVGQGGQFVQLKSKGESITFLLAGIPSYNAKHWREDKTWFYCPKIMEQKECEMCEKANDTQDAEHKRKIKAKVNFYFPILNLEETKAQIFQTGLAVRTAIEQYQKEGIDVYKAIWKVVRTEDENPAHYYRVVRLDDRKLTKEEEAEYEKALAQDVGAISEGKQSKSFPDPMPEESKKETKTQTTKEIVDELMPDKEEK